MRGWPLAIRLTVWCSATAFVLTLLTAGVQYRLLVNEMREEDNRLLLETAATVQQGVLISVRPRDVPAEFGPVVRIMDSACVQIAGAVIPDGPPTRCDATPAPPATDESSAEKPRIWIGPNGAPWLGVEQPISAVASSVLGDPRARWVDIVLNRETDVAVLAQYRHAMGLLLVVAFGCAAGLGYFIASRAFRPIDALAATVARVDVRSLDKPIRADGLPRELDALAASFETMRQRLNGAFAALTRLSAELAHDLRTPVHVLRQQAEIALTRPRTAEEYREVLASSLEELDGLSRMIDDALFLARAEDPRARIDRQPLDARIELTAVAEFLEALAFEGDVTVAVEVEAGVLVDADRTLLRRALVNLVANALRHTPAGGRITLGASMVGFVVVVTVHDTGAGVPADVLPRVFEPYVRSADERAGGAGERSVAARAGLGLAIVRGIMRLHGGSATMMSQPGEGTTVLLAFLDSAFAGRAGSEANLTGL